MVIKKNKSKRANFNWLTVVMLVVLAAYSVMLIGLILWGVMTMFKNYDLDFQNNSYRLPNEWSWGKNGMEIAIVENFNKVMDATIYGRDPTTGQQYPMEIWQLFLNGFLYAFGCAFMHTLVACITSYFCARYKYKFSKLMYSMVLIVMIIPVVGNLPSEIQMAKTLNLYNQLWGLWIMRANFLGMYFLVFHEFFKSLPDSYTEAAKIDGAGNVSILLRIALPLAKNLFLTVLLINFITFWNDYQVPLIYLPRYPTISYAVFQWTTERQLKVPQQMLASVLLLVPILIIFLCTNQKLLGNLTVGGIKG